MKEKLVTRFIILPDDRNIIIGLDANNNSLKKGIIYEIEHNTIKEIGKPNCDEKVFNYSLDRQMIEYISKLLTTEDEDLIESKVTNYPTRVQKLLDEIYEMIDEGNLDTAKNKIEEARKIIGDDSTIIRMVVLIMKLERMHVEELIKKIDSPPEKIERD